MTGVDTIGGIPGPERRGRDRVAVAPDGGLAHEPLRGAEVPPGLKLLDVNDHGRREPGGETANSLLPRRDRFAIHESERLTSTFLALVTASGGSDTTVLARNDSGVAARLTLP